MTRLVQGSCRAGRATGSCTLVSRCRLLAPDETAASMIVGGTERRPDVDQPDDRRDREDDGGDDRGEAARVEEDEGRQEVDERRHRLGVSRIGRRTVENRSLRAEPIPRARPSEKVTSVATSTWTSVSIESCQRPIRKMRARQAAATTASRTPLR